MKWKRISKKVFWEALECLPPAYWNSKGFLLGEPYDHGPDGYPRYHPFKGNANGDGPFYAGDTALSVPEFKKLTADEQSKMIDETTI